VHISFDKTEAQSRPVNDAGKASPSIEVRPLNMIWFLQARIQH